MNEIEFPEYGVTPVFNKKTDIAETTPGLSIDINAAIKNHVVEDTGVKPEYNDISEPGHVIMRLRDEFDAIDAARAIEKHRRKAGAVKSAPAAAGDANAAASYQPSPGGDSV